MANSGGYKEKIWDSDQEAATAIRRAVRDANGSEVKAAQLLGISYRSLSRYVTRLGIREELRAIQRQLGVSASESKEDLRALGQAGRKPKP